MKQIVAIVKPYLAEKVIAALGRHDVEEIGIREVKGFGRQKHYLDSYGDTEYSLAYIPKIEIAAWVDDEQAEQVIASINDVSRTGLPGDGKILVLPTVRSFTF